MVSKPAEKDGLVIKINHRNQLVVDISTEQMAALFKKQHGRPHRNNAEVETFVQRLVAEQLRKRGLLKRQP